VRVDRLRAAYDIDVQFVQFPLHPDTPEEGLTLEQLFSGRGIDISAAQLRMAKMMADEGLPYGERTMTYSSRLAQELAKWAETQPGGEAIHDALFRAYFVGGLNLASIDNLVTTARGIGLDDEEARNVLAERRFQHAVDADWQRCRELGVTGVPTFVAGDKGVVGAQSYEVLEEFLLAAGAQLRQG
jgi:predicted DsbA family dithiol-disulfide isomerase